MKYVFSIDGAYAYINHIVAHNNVPLEFSVFSDIMFNYVQLCIRRWYYGYDYRSNLEMLRVGLSMYLTEDETNGYMTYLDNIFWPRINGCIDEDVSDKTVVIVTVRSDRALMIELRQDPIKEASPLYLTLDRVCTDIDHRLYGGEYIDPTLLEIYHVYKQSIDIPN